MTDSSFKENLMDTNSIIWKNRKLEPDKIKAVLAKDGIKISRWAIRQRITRMEENGGPFFSKTKTLEDAIVQRQTSIARGKERSALKDALDTIETLRLERDSALAIKQGVRSFNITPAKGRASSEATAIWLASDWHVGEKVTRGQVNNLNEYNPTISKRRGENFFKNGLKLTDMAAKEVHVDTIVLALLGDFITGHLHLDAVENNYLAPVEETIYAQEIIISGINFILEHSKYKIIVPCHSGNHGRTTKFSHFGSENGHSLEYFMYCSIANYYRNEKRVQVIIPEGAHSYLDIYGYRVRFLHGHDVKFNGGSGGITIPLNKAISQWDKACPAYLTCLGHFHQRFDGNSFLVNGSLIGYNSFALSIKASAERPAQQFCLIDKDRGKTIVAPILVE
jgi:hypothetical protein